MTCEVSGCDRLSLRYSKSGSYGCRLFLVLIARKLLGGQPSRVGPRREAETKCEEVLGGENSKESRMQVWNADFRSFRAGVG